MNHNCTVTPATHQHRHSAQPKTTPCGLATSPGKRLAAYAVALLLVSALGACATTPPPPPTNPRVVERDLGDNKTLERAALQRPTR